MGAEYPFHYDLPSVADPNKSETDIQVSILQRLTHVAPRVFAFAVPNAGRRSRWESMQRKKEGMQSGVSDLVLTWPRVVAFAEIKDRKGALSDDQISFLNRMARMGHPAGCFRSPDTLEAWLREQGAPFIGRVTA
jgi:hypothetical protein